ncbi:MAG: hypothetical protein CMN72_12370 [Sphingomonas sp.]|uniref:Uncharacterized protein n=1 Tax=Stakelama pacifica TaxID=517720 RepID=A0A4R6FWD3_9SPHN|nr:hypothetical protein [Sphingomonas sp.]MAX00409.1 hypothetical protein [Sphingomonas sp.]TDN85334.1 hypothetical protein EV664_10239 [Stakelama pacifica]
MGSGFLRQIVPLGIALTIPGVVAWHCRSVETAFLTLGLATLLNTVALGIAWVSIRLFSQNIGASWQRLLGSALPFDLPLICSIASGIGIWNAC